MYTWVKEVKTTSNINEVNKLLQENWKLIEVYFNKKILFVLGKE